MKVAIMIPLSAAAAAKVPNLRPEGWPVSDPILWPECPHGVPLLPADIARRVQGEVEDAISLRCESLAIVTRSDVVVTRAQRMIAEGAPIEAAVYLVRDDGQERYDLASGNVLRRVPAFDQPHEDAAHMVRIYLREKYGPAAGDNGWIPRPDLAEKEPRPRAEVEAQARSYEQGLADGAAEERAVCVRIARGFGSEAVAAKIEERGESEKVR